MPVHWRLDDADDWTDADTFASRLRRPSAVSPRRRRRPSPAQRQQLAELNLNYEEIRGEPNLKDGSSLTLCHSACACKQRPKRPLVGLLDNPRDNVDSEPRGERRHRRRVVLPAPAPIRIHRLAHRRADRPGLVGDSRGRGRGEAGDAPRRGVREADLEPVPRGQLPREIQMVRPLG